MAGNFIKIISEDGHTFVITKEAAMVSGTWRNMLSSESYEEAQKGEIHSQERSDVLVKVIDYFYYNIDYKATNGKPQTEFEVPPHMALELLVAADFLHA